MIFVFILIGLVAVYWVIASMLMLSVKHRHERARRRAFHCFVLAAIALVVTLALGFGTELIMAGTGMVEVGKGGEQEASAAEQIFSGAAWWFILGGGVLLVLPTVAIGINMLRLHKKHAESVASGSLPGSLPGSPPEAK